MENFWEIKDVLYVCLFGITIVGFFWRLDTRMRESAKWKSEIERRIEKIESEDSDHQLTIRNIYSLLEKIDRKI